MAKNVNPMDEQEKLAEEAALKIPTEEEIRSSVIEEFGFDETTDSERIDKLVAKQKSQFEITSKAIAAKIKHRTDADELRKKVPPPEKNLEEKGDGLSTKDTIALMNAKVHEDDLDEVVEYAKFKKIPVSEALKTSIIKTSLAEKTEQRKTAEATNVSAARRSAVKPSDEDILSKARAGELPESDADIKRLMAIKMKALK